MKIRASSCFMAVAVAFACASPALAQSPSDRPLPAQTPAVKPKASAAAPDRKLQPIPEPPPPPPGFELDPSLEPQVTIQRKGGQTIEEYRIRGRLYMIKVTPTTGVPYYMIDNEGRGDFTRRDTLDTGTRPPMWVIHTW